MMNQIRKNKSVAVVGSVYKYLATGEDTGGAYSLFEALVPPRDPGPPPHIHRNEDEAFYVIKGELAVFLAGREFRAKPGNFISLPRGTVHSFKSTSDEIGRMLVFVSPSGFEKFLDAVGEPVEDDSMPPQPSEEHIKRIIEEAPKFGIELIL